MKMKFDIMITPGIFGAISALCLGTADFMGRFSSRAIDHYNALLGALISGFILLTFWIIVTSGVPILNWSNIASIVINGIATTIMTLLLYLGLARGPVSIVAPIVTTHPVLVILYYILWHNLEPSSAHWIAIIITVMGTLLVARSANNFNAKRNYNNKNELRFTICIAIGSCAAYAVLVVAGQAAAKIHGQYNTLWVGRLISILFLLILFGFRRQAPSIPIRWWPFLCAQGILDAGGYIFLFAGSLGDGEAIVSVVAATFGAVTVILARLILNEIIKITQWAGILLIFIGVVLLAAPI